jgi:hypothetical protein
MTIVKPEDFAFEVHRNFIEANDTDSLCQQAARQANALFARYLASCETVYGTKDRLGEWLIGERKVVADTHKAKLIAITPIGEAFEFEKE